MQLSVLDRQIVPKSRKRWSSISCAEPTLGPAAIRVPLVSCAHCWYDPLSHCCFFSHLELSQSRTTYNQQIEIKFLQGRQPNLMILSSTLLPSRQVFRCASISCFQVVSDSYFFRSSVYIQYLQSPQSPQSLQRPKVSRNKKNNKIG